MTTPGARPGGQAGRSGGGWLRVIMALGGVLLIAVGAFAVTRAFPGDGPGGSATEGSSPRSASPVRRFGSPETVRGQLTVLLERTSADDLMLTALVHDIEDRIHSLELIAEKVAGGLASAGK
jgi:hypothetical protein